MPRAAPRPSFTEGIRSTLCLMLHASRSASPILYDLYLLYTLYIIPQWRGRSGPSCTIYTLYAALCTFGDGVEHLLPQRIILLRASQLRLKHNGQLKRASLSSQAPSQTAMENCARGAMCVVRCAVRRLFLELCGANSRRQPQKSRSSILRRAKRAQDPIKTFMSL